MKKHDIHQRFLSLALKAAKKYSSAHKSYSAQASFLVRQNEITGMHCGLFSTPIESALNATQAQIAGTLYITHLSRDYLMELAQTHWEAFHITEVVYGYCEPALAFMLRSNPLKQQMPKTSFIYLRIPALMNFYSPHRFAEALRD